MAQEGSKMTRCIEFEIKQIYYTEYNSISGRGLGGSENRNTYPSENCYPAMAVSNIHQAVNLTAEHILPHRMQAFIPVLEYLSRHQRFFDSLVSLASPPIKMVFM